jgi:hypothetical protein
LSPLARAATVLPMYAIARLLQFAGLTILPLAMFWELTDVIEGPGRMLGLMVVGVLVFAAGYALQRYPGSGQN